MIYKKKNLPFSNQSTACFGVHCSTPYFQSTRLFLALTTSCCSRARSLSLSLSPILSLSLSLSLYTYIFYIFSGAIVAPRLPTHSKRNPPSLLKPKVRFLLWRKCCAHLSPRSLRHRGRHYKPRHRPAGRVSIPQRLRGTRFTCFTGTKVRILTENAPASSSRAPPPAACPASDSGALSI
jgi:hypothetical protein